VVDDRPPARAAQSGRLRVLRRPRRVRRLHGVVYDTEEGSHLAAALGNRKALLLEHHGPLTVGETVDEAAFWLHLLERCCEAQLLVASLPRRDDGSPPYRALDETIAARTFEQVGQHVHGWMGFQPLYEEIVRAEPEALD
jgi:ribulose-5-phosphate 4-epimerase/fuculose-1-phosphate aldolase